MEYKFSIEDSPWTSSLVLHFVAVAGIFTLLWAPSRRDVDVDITILSPAQSLSVPTIQQLPPQAPPKEKKPQAVQGLSRRAMTSDDGPDTKAGNTLAKEKDDLKLKPEDPDSLPIPTDEYLVTAMPTLDSEVRIPYPTEAKAKNIQGVVVMDILVDAKGSVREATLVSGPGAGLNEAAMEAVRKFRFRPAQVQDRTVAVRLRYGYRFILEK